MKFGTKIVLGVLAVVVLLGLMMAFSYNNLVTRDQEVQASWANVQTVYQRRLDLIPNLVETVKGYAGHESDVLKEVTALRSQAGQASTPAELEKVSQNINTSVRLAVEAYPELKANQNFLALQDQLEGTENRIAVARRDYNEVVKSFNGYIARFPRNLMARLFGFTSYSYFEAEAGAESAPKVDFSKKS